MMISFEDWAPNYNTSTQYSAAKYAWEFCEEYHKLEIEKLKAENEKLKSALRFYACSESKYDRAEVNEDPFYIDEEDIEIVPGKGAHYGKLSRQTLKELE